MNPYYYLFFKLYCLIKRIDNNKGHAFLAVNIISLLLIINAAFIAITIFSYIRGDYYQLWKLHVILSVIFIYLTNYLLFIRHKRYRKIVNAYKNNSSINNKLGNYIIVIYVLLTLISVFFISKSDIFN